MSSCVDLELHSYRVLSALPAGRSEHADVPSHGSQSGPVWQQLVTLKRLTPPPSDQAVSRPSGSAREGNGALSASNHGGDVTCSASAEPFVPPSGRAAPAHRLRPQPEAARHFGGRVRKVLIYVCSQNSRSERLIVNRLFVLSVGKASLLAAGCGRYPAPRRQPHLRKSLLQVWTEGLSQLLRSVRGHLRLERVLSWSRC